MPSTAAGTATATNTSFLCGDAVLLIGGSIDGAKVDEAAFNAWWTNEHLPERLAIPGFLRTRRYFALDATEPCRSHYLVCYEAAALDTLSSDAYLAALNSPTPATVKWMPHLASMDRSACRVRFSALRDEFAAQGGGARGVGATALLVSFRCPASENVQARLHAKFETDLWMDLQRSPATLALHLLEHNHKATMAGAATKCYDDANLETAGDEQQRQMGRWNLLVEFSEPTATSFATANKVQERLLKKLQEESLDGLGARLYGLICSMSE